MGGLYIVYGTFFVYGAVHDVALYSVDNVMSRVLFFPEILVVLTNMLDWKSPGMP